MLANGQVATLDDFGKLTLHGQRAKQGSGGRLRGRRRQQGSGLKKSMGHAEALQQFVRALKGEPNHLLTWDEASLATICMFAAQESIRLGAEIDLATFRKGLLDETLATEADEEAGSTP